MDSRFFPGVGAQVKEIGLGCWQLGGDWGEISEESALAILQTAVESGVNFFDTADVYGGGRSEMLIGRFRRESKAEIFVGTKLGRTGDLFPDQYTEAGLRKATEASLKRLGVEALDLTQLHCVPTEVLRRGEVFEWLRVLQAEGKIRHFGASVESVEEGLICLEQPGLASLQVIFNVLRQKPMVHLLPEAAAKNVGIIVRLPLASGLLSGRMTKATTFAQSDHRNYNRDGAAFNVGETFAGLPYELGVQLVDELKGFLPSDANLAEWSLRWILDHPAVSVIIPGASRSEQVSGNVRAAELPPLAPELHSRLADFYFHQVQPNLRGPN